MAHLAQMDDTAETIIDLYRRHALAWTTARGDRLMESAWLARFWALLSPAPSILDLGCGSGLPIGRYLAECGFAVVAQMNQDPDCGGRTVWLAQQREGAGL